MKLSERTPAPTRGKPNAWRRLPDLFNGTIRTGSVWTDGSVWVMSSLVLDGIVRHWELSMSRVIGVAKSKRPSMTDTRRVLRIFGVPDAVEKESADRSIRIFTRIVDSDLQQAEIELSNLYASTWTMPEGPCKVCEIVARTGQVCPFHPPEAET